ncbi:MAG: hypothetical protein LBR83_03405 [Clostridiales bacterium]|jgi:hypothetical protein|nr:hypothetical protein [Clostridiales bacterium]
MRIKKISALKKLSFFMALLMALTLVPVGTALAAADPTIRLVELGNAKGGTKPLATASVTFKSTNNEEVRALASDGEGAFKLGGYYDFGNLTVVPQDANKLYYIDTSVYSIYNQNYNFVAVDTTNGVTAWVNNASQNSLPDPYELEFVRFTPGNWMVDLVVTDSAGEQVPLDEVADSLSLSLHINEYHDIDPSSYTVRVTSTGSAISLDIGKIIEDTVLGSATGSDGVYPIRSYNNISADLTLTDLAGNELTGHGNVSLFDYLRDYESGHTVGVQLNDVFQDPEKPLMKPHEFTIAYNALTGSYDIPLDVKTVTYQEDGSQDAQTINPNEYDEYYVPVLVSGTIVMTPQTPSEIYSRSGRSLVTAPSYSFRAARNDWSRLHSFYQITDETHPVTLTLLDDELNAIDLEGKTVTVKTAVGGVPTDNTEFTVSGNQIKINAGPLITAYMKDDVNQPVTFNVTVDGLSGAYTVYDGNLLEMYTSYSRGRIDLKGTDTPDPDAPTVTFTTQPQAVTDVEAGSIAGSLFAEAEASGTSTVYYEWYVNNEPSPEGSVYTGERGKTFTLPANLTPGTYYYYCKASASLSGVAGYAYSDAAVVNVTGPSLTYAISAAPASLDFGTVVLPGTPAEQTVTVTNAGTGIVTLNTPALSNRNFVLSRDLNTKTLPAGGSANFSVLPAGGLPAGSYTGAVTVSGSNSVKSIEIPLSFNVTDSVVIGDTAVSVLPKTAALEPGGAQNFTARVTVSGAPDETNGVAWELTGGASADTRLTEVTTGSALLVVGLDETNPFVYVTAKAANGSSDTAIVTVDTGEEPPPPTYRISAAPSHINFGKLTAGYAQPAAKEIAVTNTGTGNVSLNAPAVSDRFETAAAMTPTELAPNGTAAFSVRPKAGLAAGVHTGTVTVTGSDGVTASVSLTFEVTSGGTVVPPGPGENRPTPGGNRPIGSGRSGGGGGRPQPKPPANPVFGASNPKPTSAPATAARDAVTLPANGGAVSVEYTLSGGTVTVLLPNAKLTEIIENAEGDTVSFDLSGIEGAGIAELPRTAFGRFADGGLSVEILLPEGAVTFDEAAAASLAEARGRNISVSLDGADASALTDAQLEAVGEGDLIGVVTVLAGGNKIAGFEGEITVEVPYEGELPVEVYWLTDDGALEKVTGDYDEETGTVTFAAAPYSVYVIRPAGEGSAPEPQGGGAVDAPPSVAPQTPARESAAIESPALMYVNESSPADEFGVPPFISRYAGDGYNIGLLSLRAFTDAVGASRAWDDATKTVTITGTGANGVPVTLSLVSNGTEITVNGVTHDIADYAGAPNLRGLCAALNENGSVYLPLRAICNAFGITVTWDETTGSAALYR